MPPLPLLEKNQVGRIVSFSENNSSKALRFMEMGLAKDSKIKLLQKLSLKKMLILLTEHGKYSVRTEDCHCIQVEILSKESL